MELMRNVKNNTNFIIILGVIILLGTIGITYALSISRFTAIGVDTTALDIDATISYDGGGSELISNGKMLPISDTLVTIDTSDERVLKATFNVTGKSTNPDNTIYDIALRDVNIDCELRTEDVKWRLYKGTVLLSEGNLSPTFDTIAHNRLVLTNIAQDLTTTTDSYTFLLWISESCTDDIINCESSSDQSKYLNKTFGASIKVELSTKSKKTLTRVTGSADSCT